MGSHLTGHRLRCCWQLSLALLLRGITELRDTAPIISYFFLVFFYVRDVTSPWMHQIIQKAKHLHIHRSLRSYSCVLLTETFQFHKYLMKWPPIADSHFRANCYCGQTTVSCFVFACSITLQWMQMRNWLLKYWKHLLNNSDCFVSTSRLHYFWNDADQESIEIQHGRKVKVMNTSYTGKRETADSGAKCQWQLICTHLFPRERKAKVILLAYSGRAVSYKPGCGTDLDSQREISPLLEEKTNLLHALSVEDAKRLWHNTLHIIFSKVIRAMYAFPHLTEGRQCLNWQ